ncbi:hypothetical protein EXIGLDRAFT_498417 [Exidia glandulosa HHB12029]|uniref:Uncharacterized protein n=1 Tax=Exidia glandulosa HHB12029 TaxID=1314781 RepID=A0A166N826_EXIGL|nr:hypothetical protein EXIGLDRAFT_498417 [Exidia glandulosa HHB12029]
MRGREGSAVTSSQGLARRRRRLQVPVPTVYQRIAELSQNQDHGTLYCTFSHVSERAPSPPCRPSSNYSAPRALFAAAPRCICPDSGVGFIACVEPVAYRLFVAISGVRRRMVLYGAPNTTAYLRMCCWQIRPELEILTRHTSASVRYLPDVRCVQLWETCRAPLKLTA